MSQSFLVFDIETVLDPELPEQADPEKLPPPPFHQVMVIGALQIGSDYSIRQPGILADGLNENTILSRFTNLCAKYQPNLVTFNGRGFDLPVIASRCFKYGIPFKNYYQDRDMRYRFSADGHFDIMDYMSDYGATKPTKLDILAKLIGMPGKVGIDGKDVAKYVADGKIEEVRDYCLCDVVQTAGVFLRLQLVRGMIDRDKYVIAMTELIDIIHNNDKLKPVFEGINKDKLLLKEDE